MTPALIKRVESATGEDRRLDAYIFSAFHREPIEPAQTWSVMDSFQFRFTDGRKNALYVHEDDVPAYSSSLDAAVSLANRVCPGRLKEIIEAACEAWWSRPNYTADEFPRFLVLAVLRAVTP